MIILDGKKLSLKLKDELALENKNFKTPVLAVITIGNDSSSQIYVKNKKNACEYVGMSFLHLSFDENEKEEKIIKKIRELNKDKNINGIILQLPIPSHFDKTKIINTIDPIKDVDGLTTASQGKLLSDEEGTFIPCTPKGILEIFKEYKIDLEGKHVVVVGRSILVGKPIMLECLKRNATCTICHSKTTNLKEYTKKADILIVCTGKKHLINSSMIKENSIIIDVGISRDNGKIYGDVNPNVDKKCSMRTPVPGGIGPMTVVMLLKNTLTAYRLQNGDNNEK